MVNRIIQRLKKALQRRINQRCAYDYSTNGANWEKSDNNPVLGSESMGSLFDPFVRYIDDRYVMCVSRRQNKTIELYDSVDGRIWKNPITVLSGVSGSTWETEVNRGCFLIRDDQWYLWYTGQHNGKSCIGLATSKDGHAFVRNSDVPVMVPEFTFEGVSVMNPCVLWDDERKIYRMWYAAGENYEPDVLCYAESRDGILWKKKDAPIMTALADVKYQKSKVGACDVLKLSKDLYCMAYIAYENINVARIAFAYSKDGISSWTLDKSNPIIVPEKGKWDCHAVYKPTICLDPDGGMMNLWYNGRRNHSERIGLAFCDSRHLASNR